MEQSLRDFLYDPAVGKIVTVIIGIMIVWLVIHTIQKRIFNRINDNQGRYRANKISSFIGYVLVVLIIVFTYSDRVSGLSTALGVAGAGIAFALQEVIASFAGWLAILFGGFYRTGDRVQLGGIKGDVMDIGVLRTTIMETGEWVDGDLYNGRIVLVANSFVFKEPVFNYSADFPFLWDEIKVPINFGSNYDMAAEIIETAGKTVTEDLTGQSRENWKNLQRRYRLEDARTDPQISLVANQNYVEYTLRYVVNYKLRRSTKSKLFRKIIRDIEATGGKVKFAYAAIQIVQPSSLNVKIDNEQ